MSRYAKEPVWACRISPSEVVVHVHRGQAAPSLPSPRFFVVAYCIPRDLVAVGSGEFRIVLSYHITAARDLRDVIVPKVLLYILIARRDGCEARNSYDMYRCGRIRDWFLK